MTVTLNLPPETARKLHELAAQAGQSLERYIEQLLRERAHGVTPQAGSRTWEEVCAPIAEAVEASGMTDDQVRDFFTEVRDEVRAEKRARRAQDKPGE